MIRELRLTQEAIAESDARRRREWDIATAPMIVQCPRCRAIIGEHCKSKGGYQNSAVGFHAARRAAVAGRAEDDIVTAQGRVREQVQKLRDICTAAREEAP
jgi:hypothetical protein